MGTHCSALFFVSLNPVAVRVLFVTHVVYIRKDGKDQKAHLWCKMCFLNKTNPCRVSIGICFTEGIHLQDCLASLSLNHLII